MDLYGGHTFDLRTRVDTWTSMDVVSVEYGTHAHILHLTKCFFQFDKGIKFRWYDIMWWVVDIFSWIGLFT